MTVRGTERSHVDDSDQLVLRAVAYRMLGSASDADDAVQEAWLRLARSDVTAVRNLDAWLTTVVARICLDQLRGRVARREEPLDVHVPDPVVTFGPDTALPPADPAEEAALADSVGAALLVVLDALTPAERLAFVLHDMFAVPFEEIGAILDRTPGAAKQLASRARARVRGAGPGTEPDPARHRAAVDAFLAAARGGNFADLVALLHPDVVLRADAGDSPLGPSVMLHGARAVGEQAARYTALARYAVPATVNGRAGLLTAPGGRVAAVMALDVTDGLISRIEILADPQRLDRLHLVVPEPPGALA
jgi:RNA polymerase sigma factor (sigma-70 family)